MSNASTRLLKNLKSLQTFITSSRSSTYISTAGDVYVISTYGTGRGEGNGDPSAKWMRLQKKHIPNIIRALEAEGEIRSAENLRLSIFKEGEFNCTFICKKMDADAPDAIGTPAGEDSIIPPAFVETLILAHRMMNKDSVLWMYATSEDLSCIVSSSDGDITVKIESRPFTHLIASPIFLRKEAVSSIISFLIDNKHYSIDKSFVSDCLVMSISSTNGSGVVELSIPCVPPPMSSSVSSSKFLAGNVESLKDTVAALSKLGKLSGDSPDGVEVRLSPHGWISLNKSGKTSLEDIAVIIPNSKSFPRKDLSVMSLPQRWLNDRLFQPLLDEDSIVEFYLSPIDFPEQIDVYCRTKAGGIAQFTHRF